MHRDPNAVATPGPSTADGRAPSGVVDCPFSKRCVSPSGRAAVALLLEACEYARDLERSPWDFAVEIAALRQTGLTTSTLRWMVCKGYLEHRCERPVQGSDARSFRADPGLRFCEHTCFVLTEAGLAFARKVFESEVESHGNWVDSSPDFGNGLRIAHRPIWDQQRRELRVGEIVVKQFRVPAANQEAILAAFEEEGWPVRVDDPLSPHPDQEPKTRLHHTINSLNRNQQHPLVRFAGDGSGQGVRWSLVESGGNGNGKLALGD